jgi:hypothetical protein
MAQPSRPAYAEGTAAGSLYTFNSPVVQSAEKGRVKQLARIVKTDGLDVNLQYLRADGKTGSVRWINSGTQTLTRY